MCVVVATSVTYAPVSLDRLVHIRPFDYECLKVYCSWVSYYLQQTTKTDIKLKNSILFGQFCEFVSEFDEDGKINVLNL